MLQFHPRLSASHLLILFACGGEVCLVGLSSFAPANPQPGIKLTKQVCTFLAPGRRRSGSRARGL